MRPGREGDLRPLRPGDGARLLGLGAREGRLYLRFPPETLEALLSRGVGHALLEGSRWRAALLAYVPEGGAPWIAAAYVASGTSPRANLERLLEALPGAIPEHAAERALYFLEDPYLHAWLEPYLKPLGFAAAEEVGTWIRSLGTEPPPPTPRGVRLRPYRAQDLSTLVAIDREAFEPRWRFGAWWLERELRGVALVAEVEGEVVGFACGPVEEGWAHLTRIAVAPRAQGRGIGRALLARFLEETARRGVREVTLNTQAGNRRAHRLYRALGFQPLTERYRIWRRPLDQK